MVNKYTSKKKYVLFLLTIILTRLYGDHLALGTVSTSTITPNSITSTSGILPPATSEDSVSEGVTAVHSPGGGMLVQQLPLLRTLLLAPVYHLEDPNLLIESHLLQVANGAGTEQSLPNSHSRYCTDFGSSNISHFTIAITSQT